MTRCGSSDSGSGSGPAGCSRSERSPAPGLRPLRCDQPFLPTGARENGRAAHPSIRAAVETGSGLACQKNAAPSIRKGTPHKNPNAPIAVFGRCGSALLGVPVRVDRREALPLLRQILQRKNRRHRADRNAGTAVDALHGADIQLRFGLEFGFVLPRVDAIDGTNVRRRRCPWFLCRVQRSRTPCDSPSRDIYSLKILNRHNILHGKHRFISPNLQQHKQVPLPKKYSTSELCRFG